MKRRLRHLSYLLTLLSTAFVAACDDPAALTGCDAPHGCEVIGQDLAILEAQVLWASDQEVNDQVEMRVVEPGEDLRARIVIVNRGDATTEPTHLIVEQMTFDVISADTVAVPSLEPGEEFRTVRDVIAPEFASFTSPVIQFRARLCGLELDPATCWDVDLDPSNNTQHFGTYHLRVPYYHAEITSLPDTVRGGAPYPVGITVSNESPFVVSEGVRVGFCLFNAFAAGQSCNEEYPGFGVVDVPPITAQASVVVPAMVEVPKDAFLFIDRDRDFREFLAPCFITAEAPDAAINDVLQRGCSTSVEAWFIASLDDACAPPTLVVPDTLASANAGVMCEHHGVAFLVVALDVESDDRLLLTPAGEIGIFHLVDRNLEWLDPIETTTTNAVFEFEEAGRYHLFIRDPGATASIVVEAAP